MELTMASAKIAVPERLDGPSVALMAAQLERSANAFVVMLEGVPGRFCLGMDFVTALAPDTRTARRTAMRRHLGAFAHCLKLLLESPRPTLAVVDGPAIGGGLGLAAACDFVLATTRAHFGLPEALYGLAPAIIRPALLTRLTPQQINLMLFTCHSRSAAQAAELGLVDQVVPTEQLDDARRGVVRQLRRACSRTVAASRSWTAREIDRGLRAGLTATAAALDDHSVLAALRAATFEENLPWIR
jgi:enoyl-CoA hydratase/carnithine racemase